MVEPSYEQLVEAAARLHRRIHATMDQRALEHDNRQRSMWDRIERGLSPFGAATSRYEPTEEADDP